MQAAQETVAGSTSSVDVDPIGAAHDLVSALFALTDLIAAPIIGEHAAPGALADQLEVKNQVAAGGAGLVDFDRERVGAIDEQ